MPLVTTEFVAVLAVKEPITQLTSIDSVTVGSKVYEAVGLFITMVFLTKTDRVPTRFTSVVENVTVGILESAMLNPSVDAPAPVATIENA